MTLTGRAVLITGAKRIGAAVAVGLARRGADVAVSYWRSRDEALHTVEAIRACGRQGLAVQADLRCPHGSRDAVQQVVEAFGRLDVLIAMASVYRKIAFDDLTEEDWKTNLAVDLSSAFFCAQAAVPHMRRAGTGHIVLVADSEAACGRPRHHGYLPYFVAKSGLIGLGRALAFELARDRIFVNTLGLGPMLPADHVPDDELEATAASTPMGCWGGVDEVTKGVTHLLDSAYMTGELIRLDGGRHLA